MHPHRRLQLTRQLVPVPPQRRQIRMPQHPPHRVHVRRRRQQMRRRRMPQPVRRHTPPPHRLHPLQHPVDHPLHITPRQPPPPPRQQQRLRLPPPVQQPPPVRQIRVQHLHHRTGERHVPRPPALTEDPPVPRPPVDEEILRVRRRQLRHPRPHRRQQQHDQPVPQLRPLIPPPRRRRLLGQITRRPQQPLRLLHRQRAPLRPQPAPLLRTHRHRVHRIQLHPPRHHRIPEERRHRTPEPRLRRRTLQRPAPRLRRPRPPPLIRFAREPEQHLIDVLTGQIVQHPLRTRQRRERHHVPRVHLCRPGRQRTRRRLRPHHLPVTIHALGHCQTLNIGRTHPPDATARHRQNPAESARPSAAPPPETALADHRLALPALPRGARRALAALRRRDPQELGGRALRRRRRLRVLQQRPGRRPRPQRPALHRPHHTLTTHQMGRRRINCANQTESSFCLVCSQKAPTRRRGRGARGRLWRATPAAPAGKGAPSRGTSSRPRTGRRNPGDRARAAPASRDSGRLGA